MNKHSFTSNHAINGHQVAALYEVLGLDVMRDGGPEFGDLAIRARLEIDGARHTLYLQPATGGMLHISGREIGADAGNRALARALGLESDEDFESEKVRHALAPLWAHAQLLMYRALETIATPA